MEPHHIKLFPNVKTSVLEGNNLPRSAVRGSFQPLQEVSGRKWAPEGSLAYARIPVRTVEPLAYSHQHFRSKISHNTL